jgi:hypothetical protein
MTLLDARTLGLPGHLTSPDWESKRSKAGRRSTQIAHDLSLLSTLHLSYNDMATQYRSEFQKGFIPPFQTQPNAPGAQHKLDPAPLDDITADGKPYKAAG